MEFLNSEPYYARKKNVNQSSDFPVRRTGSYRHKKALIFIHQTGRNINNYKSFRKLNYKHSIKYYKLLQNWQKNITYTEAILSNNTPKMSWFETTTMLIAVLKINLLCHLLQFSAHFLLYTKANLQLC